MPYYGMLMTTEWYAVAVVSIIPMSLLKDRDKTTGWVDSANRIQAGVWLAYARKERKDS